MSGPASPLVVRAPDVLIPGVLSLTRLSPCNDAVVVPGPPVRAVLPPARWAYGVLFPLDHGPVRAEGDRPVVVCLEIAVESGAVGVMGVDDRAAAATTTETVVGPGRTTVSVTLDEPTRTSAIVLRNVAETGAPRVTMTAIGAYRMGPRRLAARTHDLGYDLFVVLAPGKAATQTIEQTLLGLAPGVQVRRAHRLSEEIVPVPAHLASENPLARSAKVEFEHAQRITAEIEWVRRHGGRVAVITSVRDPVDGIVSGLFQVLPEAIPAFETLHAIGPQFLDMLAAGLTTHMRRLAGWPAAHVPDAWFWRSPAPVRWFFGEEFRQATGVDLLAHPVDRERGFTLLPGEGQTILLVRFEDIARGLVPGLAALTGRPALAIRDSNRSDDKPYRSLYREFRAMFRIPVDLAEELYDRDPYVRHLYTPGEVAAFKARWTTA